MKASYDEVMTLVRGIRTALPGNSAARHKAVLLLWILREVKRGGPNAFSFLDLEAEVADFLQSPLGAGRKTDVSMPFWHLRHDKLWKCPQDGLKMRMDGKRPCLSDTRKQNPVGSLRPDVYNALRNDNSLLSECVSELLKAFWGARDHAAVRERLQLLEC